MTIVSVWVSLLVLFVFSGFVAFIFLKHKSAAKLTAVFFTAMSIVIFAYLVRRAFAIPADVVEILSVAASVSLGAIGVMVVILVLAIALVGVSSLLIVLSSAIVPNQNVLDRFVPVVCSLLLFAFGVYAVWVVASFISRAASSLFGLSAVFSVVALAIPAVAIGLALRVRILSKRL